MALRIRLLGKPTVVGDGGDSRTVRGHQAWAVLARVLLSDRPIHRRDLASELFPDVVDPLGSLRGCLASLRRAIGPQTLAGDPIRQNLPGGTDVDVWNIVSGEYDVEEADDLLKGTEPKASAEFGTWLLIERERTASLVDARIRQETMVAISVGDYSRAIRLAELGVRRRPFEESAHILLAKSLVLDGRPETALKHVEATERAFLAEIGEKPSPALRSSARPTISSAPLGVPPRAVVESLISSGVAALSAGAVEAGLDCLRRAVADAEAAKEKYLLAKSLVELGSALVHSVRGYDDEGAIHLRQATELARQCGAAEIASTGLRELGYVEALAGRRPAAALLLDAAIESTGGDRDGLAGIHAIIAFNLVDWGKVDEGLAHYELSLDHARSAGNRRREIWSLGLGGWGQLAANKPETACEWLESCLASCDEMRWLAFRPWPFAVLAEARLKLQDDPVSLRRGLEDAFALSCQLGDPCWEAATGRSLALTYAAAEEYEAAMRWLVKARETLERISDPYARLLVEILSDQVELNLKVGEPDPGGSGLRELLSLAARTHTDAHLRRAIEMIEQGKKS
jgi:DNA-binding SARP family transcriptional activator